LSLEVGLMKATATVRLQFSSEKHLTTLLEALAPEANAPVTRRAKAILEKEGTFLLLKVEAVDTVALRATLNAYLRWIGSMKNVVATLERAS
jgi:tRNA threonylcarbamoyladenosine modification (KEOPS) complex  Pcc1 subunit